MLCHYYTADVTQTLERTSGQGLKLVLLPDTLQQHGKLNYIRSDQLRTRYLIPSCIYLHVNQLRAELCHELAHIFTMFRFQ